MINYFDIAALIVISLCVFAGWRRGLVRMVFGLVSLVASVFLAYQLYPVVGGLLRKTSLYDRLCEGFISSLDIRGLLQANAEAKQGELIRSLPLPEAILGRLEAMNTPDVYELLNVRTVEEYVGGFFANMTLSFIAVVIVFAAVMILMGILGGALDMVAKLPVINALNRAGGLAAGFLIGVALTWAFVSAVNLLGTGTGSTGMLGSLENSYFAKWFLDNNWLFFAISQVR
ncbi:MAG: CvpA family protein [Defluviitaleaceae bacterium]|nr:CvpA family protein [Defluviitaleaceae bacterium]